MVNGYVFLDLTKSNVYTEALKVLGTDKPVVIKDGGGSPYFVDSLTLDGTNVVITKGGKTITIANDNTITNVGDIQNHLYEHNICIRGDNDDSSLFCSIKIISKNNVIMSLEDVFNYLKDNGFNTETTKNYIATGCINTYVITGIYIDNNTYDIRNLKFRLSGDDNTFITGFDDITDTIIQLF